MLDTVGNMIKELKQAKQIDVIIFHFHIIKMNSKIIVKGLHFWLDLYKRDQKYHNRSAFILPRKQKGMPN